MSKERQTKKKSRTVSKQLLDSKALSEFKKKYQHDSFCKEHLEDRERAREFLRFVLDKELQKALVIEEVQIDKESYIDADLKKLYADVVYRVPYKNGDGSVVVYILIELKTENDKWTIFQLVKYVVRIWDGELKLARKEKRLDTFLFPMIIPIIFHHGGERFTSPTELIELVRVIKGLEQFTLNMKALLFDVTPMGKDEMPQDILLCAFFMVLQAAFSKESVNILMEIFELLKPHFDQPEVLQEWLKDLYYLVTSGKYFTHDVYEQVKTKIEKRGIKIMSISVIDQLYAEGIEKGIEQGMERGFEKGIAEGIEKGIAEGILRTLNKRFKRVPKKFEKQILTIANLEKLEELADFAYDCVTLDEFEKALK
ncbi:MAG: Rpn family recombination-promoting nuclease/putative transposase [Planctomycetaceae bacterium]|jgi:predicted transposase YdaD|nr:Rpn family recombination-promoting nuclease/putative transposase [Planctomycetaceae bacterium]